MTVVVWVFPPPAAVIVTVYVPGVSELQEIVAVPEPVRLPGLIPLHVRPVGIGSTVSVTVPPNPLLELTAIVDVACPPVVTAAGCVEVI